MINITPIIKSSLTATATRLFRKGWLKQSFTDAFLALWTNNQSLKQNELIAKQFDDFNWDLHCELSSIASMLKLRTGLLAGDFFARIVFTKTLTTVDPYKWDLLEQVSCLDEYIGMTVKLYQSQIAPEKMTVVFITGAGVSGKAYWDFEKLEVFSEEL